MYVETGWLTDLDSGDGGVELWREVRVEGVQVGHQHGECAGQELGAYPGHTVQKCNLKNIHIFDDLQRNNV